MNKKIIDVILMCLVIVMLAGCDSSTNQYKPSTYKYDSNSKFKIVSVEEINDGSINGMTISTLVDKSTRVMYLQTEKYSDGYAIGLQVLVDKDGKPLIYDDNLK
ncbi:DUF6440 family protein [Clostridium sp. MT-14]|uniref:DUF6440 family protein n=1 Tax=unclassified Clostridium TaxID=2614128 RepID=UPI00156CC9A3|nr:DUF6440 family protein [Clostridium sp. HV4-5-A1G]CAB1249652.1 exported hypothetical protein [Clostridiaceae bacterium BL-3]